MKSEITDRNLDEINARLIGNAASKTREFHALPQLKKSTKLQLALQEDIYSGITPPKIK
jgi:hypothetical protein